MKIKLLCFLVAIVMVVVGLASCKPQGNTGDGGSTVDPKYYWGSATIEIAAFENDNAGELSSGIKRFYAGGTNDMQDVDKDIRARNAKATEVTGVTANYLYEGYTGFAWGKSLDKLGKDVAVEAGPDIACNFVYDMTAGAIRGYFKNLYTNTSKSSSTAGQGNNFFAFTKDGYTGIGNNYFDSKAGGGYFYDYMQSLSLKNANGEYDKMYVLASDYCIDLVRSFLVMPVNIDMMNITLGDNLTTEQSEYIKDRTGDGKHDFNDFYKLVWDGGFTYDALAAYSSAVFASTGTDATTDDIGDTLGVAFGKSSGLTASGLLYTTDVEIIKNVNGTYAYPDDNPALAVFAEKLATLVVGDGSQNGVAVVSGTGDIANIRARFGDDNNMLFGGIVALGSLEEQDYQKMADNGRSGFGVVCVPLYEAKANGKDAYRTLVHNLARLPSISVYADFEQCSAYLDYVSTNSADILESYYNDVLISYVNVGDAKTENVKMLQFIRNHVNNCFEKTYEDVVSAYMQSTGDSDALGDRWHDKLMADSYVCTTLSTQYGELVGEVGVSGSKANNLDLILKEWAELK